MLGDGPEALDDLDMLADLAGLIGERQAELRRMVIEVAALIEGKLNEIDRLGQAAQRCLTHLQNAR